MLPHLKSRPASLVRAPEGVGGELFFQKHADVRTMPGVKELPDLWEGHGPLLEVPTRQGAGRGRADERHRVPHLEFGQAEGGQARSHDLRPRPRRGRGVRPGARRRAADARAARRSWACKCWLKTSGGKGLHVVVPLSARLDYDTVKAFSQQVVQHLARDDPAALRRQERRRPTASARSSSTTCATASTRRPPPRSRRARGRGWACRCPIAWDELPEIRSGAHWTISDARDRLSFQKVDPWADYWDVPADADRGDEGAGVGRLTRRGSPEPARSTATREWAA